MTHTLAILIMTAGLAGCSASDIGKAALSAAVGGGPSVNANAQVGKTNSQTIGSTRTIEMSGPVARPESVETLTQNTEQDASENRVKADSVEMVVVNEIPALLIWLLVGLLVLAVVLGVLGWMAPVPKWVERRR